MLIPLSWVAMAEKSCSSDQLLFFLVMHALLIPDCIIGGCDASFVLVGMSLRTPLISIGLEGGYVGMIYSIGKLPLCIVLAMNLHDLL
jgi:hypothetical protein